MLLALVDSSYESEGDRLANAPRFSCFPPNYRYPPSQLNFLTKASLAMKVSLFSTASSIY